MISIDIHKELQGSNGLMSLDINLNIEENSFVAVSGKSGSGKTTFLRILAGLESANGTLKVEDKIVKPLLTEYLELIVIFLTSKLLFF